MKNMNKTFCAIALAALTFTSCTTEEIDNGNQHPVSYDNETMYQVATLQSLMVGNYDGYVPVGTLRQWGDIGLGTFDKVDGEMIVLDGTVYQARYDGTVNVASDNTGVPFATVTHFDTDYTLNINSLGNIAQLSELLTAEVNKRGMNLIYALRIDVSQCEKVHVRSELPQEKPYRPLAEALKTDQREFVYNDIDGTIVAVYFPAFFNMQNTPGWHFHFISSDRTRGGHMLDIISTTPMQAKLDATTYFQLYMPEDTSFSMKDLSKDMSKEIEDVEK